MISADLVGCATARSKGTCDNRKNIRRDRLEERVLSALCHHLMEPVLFKEFCDEFAREMNHLHMDGQDLNLRSSGSEFSSWDHACQLHSKYLIALRTRPLFPTVGH